MLSFSKDVVVKQMNLAIQQIAHLIENISIFYKGVTKSSVGPQVVSVVHSDELYE